MMRTEKRRLVDLHKHTQQREDTRHRTETDRQSTEEHRIETDRQNTAEGERGGRQREVRRDKTRQDRGGERSSSRGEDENGRDQSE
jgi:hypothetical protein